MNIEEITNDTVIVCSNSVKQNLLSKIKRLLPIKFMNNDLFFSKLTYEYNEEAIYYIMKKYNVKYSISKILIKNSLYVDLDEKYNDQKLTNLQNIKKELIQKKLFIKDEIFLKTIKNKDVIIYNTVLDKYQKKLLKNIDYKIIINDTTNYSNKVYEFDKMEDEIEFVAASILQNLQNSSISKIKLMNVNEEYQSTIKRIFGIYNIPISFKQNIYGLYSVQKFIKKLKETKNIEESIDQNTPNEVIQICNKYNFTKTDDYIIECIIEELKEKNIYKEKYDKEIQIIDFDYIIDDEIVYLIGCNETVFPFLHKDEDYLTDKQKQIVGIDTSIEKNKLEKAKAMNILKNNKLIISYKLSSTQNIYFKSDVIEQLNLEVIKDFKLNNIYNYSILFNKLKLAKKLDKLNKFNIVENDLSLLYSNYPNIDYMKYDNSFTGIEKNDLYEFLNNKLILSYSSIDNYFRCGFKFYISNILKLDKFEESFAIKIGNIFHYVLSKYLQPDFDFDLCFNNYISSITFSSSDKVFLKKLRQELLFIIDVINEQNRYSNLKHEEHEKKIYINMDKNIKITFMGVVDKIKMDEQKKIAAIIDYKTGIPVTDLTKTKYGIKMQLPIYLYLVKNEYKDIKIAGIYLQKILNSELNYDSKKDYIKAKKDLLKLDGYSTSNEEILSKFDITYKNSEFIKSLNQGSNGFYAYSKVISDEQIEKLSKIAEEKVKEARDDIIDAKFDINPKKIGKELLGCEFCNFKDICYKKEEDVVELEEIKDLEFLR